MCVCVCDVTLFLLLLWERKHTFLGYKYSYNLLPRIQCWRVVSSIVDYHHCLTEWHCWQWFNAPHYLHDYHVPACWWCCCWLLTADALYTIAVTYIDIYRRAGCRNRTSITKRSLGPFCCHTHRYILLQLPLQYIYILSSGGIHTPCKYTLSLIIVRLPACNSKLPNNAKLQTRTETADSR